MSFVSDGGASGIANIINADALVSSELAGVAPYAQTCLGRGRQSMLYAPAPITVTTTNATQFYRVKGQ